MADGTRLKGQHAIDKLQEEVQGIREELADLHQLKQEVQQIKADMRTIPLMDQKLSTMESSLHSMLQQILRQTAPDDAASASTHNQKDNIITNTTMGTIPASLPVTNLQSTFQQVNTTVSPSSQAPTVHPQIATSAVFTDSTAVSVAREAQVTSAPFRLSIPIVTKPPVPEILPKPPYTMQNQIPQQQMFTGNFGHYSNLIAPQYTPSHMYNPVTGQFINGNNPPTVYQSGVQLYNDQRNTYATQLGGPSYYAQAVLKGPRLEIPLFSGEDPIGWLVACEKFFDMTGTPYDQWVNLATGHFQGRASTWLKNICVPWQMVTWQQFCNLIADRFTEANAHEAVEMLQTIRQTDSVATYIDKFEECVALVKRDHPYLQESFLLSCFIGGLKPEIKHDVSGQRPNSLLESYWYSKNYEKAANARNVALSPPNYRSSFQPFQSSNKPPPTLGPATAAMPENLHGKDQKSCWYCKEPWNRQHKCRTGRTLHILQEIDDGSETMEVLATENQQEQHFHTAPNTPTPNHVPTA